jgi:glycosyltransferase involved in cell wall biosynthesis
MNQTDKLPLVSIITPVFNGSDYIEELIQSVKSQDYGFIEHIIIDDGSQDDGKTIALLEKYPHLIWWTRPNRGQYATMNEGLQAAKGAIICFISADDLLSPAAVRSAVEYLLKNNNLDGVYGRTRFIQNDGTDGEFQPPFSGRAFNLYPFLAHVSHCSLYLRTRALRDHSLYFNDIYQYTGDYEWMIRLVLAGLNIGFIKKDLSLVRIHKNQATQIHRHQILKEKETIVKYYHFYNLKYRFFAFLIFISLANQKLRSSYQKYGIKGSLGLILDWVYRKTGNI